MEEALAGLSPHLLSYYKDVRHVPCLYEWQQECLTLIRESFPANVVYTQPTSSGKTLVAEISALQCLLAAEKDVIFILPFVALAEEKAAAFQKLAMFLENQHGELLFKVYLHAGNKGHIPPIRRRRRPMLFVATIEKAYGLLNYLLSQRRMLSKLGLVLVDELHMLGTRRGSLLELLLTLVKLEAAPTRIIGMSATLGNIKDMTSFLKAKLYEGHFRPVSLEEHVCIQGEIMRVGDFLQLQPHVGPKHKSAKRTASANVSAFPSILDICKRTVEESGSVLIFNPSKDRCRTLSQRLAQELASALSHKHQHQHQQHAQARRGLSDQLMTLAGERTVLSRVVLEGVAFHHASLSAEERKEIESAFLDRLISVLVCTSTLAAGVNLPARRVIINGLYMGPRLITKIDYTQMVGRAGRAGIDKFGESFLILPPEQVRAAKQMLEAPTLICTSRLNEGMPCRLTQLILSTISLTVAYSEAHVCRCSHIFRALVKSFYGVQCLASEWQCEAYKQLELLCNMDAISSDVRPIDTKAKVHQPANKGIEQECGKSLQIASLKEEMRGMVCAAHVYRELKAASHNLALVDNLHLIFLTAPPDQVAAMRIDWPMFGTSLRNLPASQKEIVVSQIGLSQAFFENCGGDMRWTDDSHLQRQPLSTYGEADTAKARRLYVALLLQNLLADGHRVSRSQIAAKFGLKIGDVEALLQCAGMHCKSLATFCAELPEFWAFETLFGQLVDSLYMGVDKKLVSLMELSFITPKTASVLYKNGIKDIKGVVQAPPSKLIELLHRSPEIVDRIQNQARDLYMEERQTKQDEYEQMDIDLEDAAHASQTRRLEEP